MTERSEETICLFHRFPERDQALFSGKYIPGLRSCIRRRSALAVQFDCKPGSIRMKLTRARRNAVRVF